MSGDAIVVDHVSKTYRYGTGPTTIKQAVLAGVGSPRRAPVVSALSDVSLRVAEGRTLGIVGHNGAGKSTLLRLIGGVGRPDSGHIAVRGSVAALFELGAGFHPDLTGRESVVLGGLVAGLSRRDVERRISDIVEFAGIGDAIDRPVRTYSSGMEARLGFSLAIHVDAEVLLVDEILAVGDLAFRQRCFDRLRALRRDGITAVVISHEPERIHDLCDEAVLLWDGRVASAGPPREVTARFVGMMAEQMRDATPDDLGEHVTPTGAVLRPGHNRFGSQEARVMDVHVLDPWGAPTAVVPVGSGIAVHVHVDIPASVGAVNLGVAIRAADGRVCVDSNTRANAGTGEALLSIGRLDLAPGDYRLDAGLWSENWAATFDYHHAAYPLRVEGEPTGNGAVLSPPLEWRFLSSAEG